MPRVNVRLDEELYDRLARAAKGRGHRISWLVRDVLAAGLDDNQGSAVEAAEERISATLDRFAKDIRRLHTADQALYAAFDTFVRLFLTCIPDPPSDCLTAAKVQGHQRYNNYLHNVARNMNGDARVALGELTNCG
jgi:predicted DNA-binding protein